MTAPVQGYMNAVNAYQSAARGMTNESPKDSGALHQGEFSNLVKSESPIATEGVKTPLVFGNLSFARHTADSANILELDPYPGSISPVTFAKAFEPLSKVI